MLRRIRLILLRWARALARPRRGSLFLGLLGLASVVGTGLWLGIPQPVIHDEFSYLLAADTFAHGRLTNPTPPSAKHFESFHILVRPTYSSKYPPGQGLVLALGQVTLGQPIWGVWILGGLLPIAVFWALRGWIASRWAFLGGLLAVATLGFGSYWAQTYWGGYVAAIGGCLVVGGVRRLADRPSLPSAVPTGLGLVVLANSRPYEGLVLALGGGIGLLVAGLRGSHERRRALLLRGVLPASIVVVAGLLFTLAHNRAVTGDAFRFPYLVHVEQYVAMPYFLGQRATPRNSYTHPDLAAFYGEIEPQFAVRAGQYPREALSRLRTLVTSFVGLPLAWVGLAVPVAWRRRGVRAAVGWAALAFLGHCAATVFFVHYAAPMSVLAVVLFAFGARGWSKLRVLRVRAGGWIVPLVLLGMAWAAGASVADAQDRRHIQELGLGGRRPAAIRQLESEGPSHLVFVRYGPNHLLHREWVYNAADLETAPILWARDIGDAENRRLADRHPRRTLWRLTVDWDQQAPFLERLPR